MKEGRAFIDTNVLLYLLSANELKAGRAEEIVAGKGIISVQVLNEFASIAMRKLGMSWREIQEILFYIRSICPVQAVSIEVHDRGSKVAERYGYAVYDAMIIASALMGGCTTLYSEDMQDGQVIDGKLSILNPFI